MYMFECTCVCMWCEGFSCHTCYVIANFFMLSTIKWFVYKVEENLHVFQVAKLPKINKSRMCALKVYTHIYTRFDYCAWFDHYACWFHHCRRLSTLKLSLSQCLSHSTVATVTVTVSVTWKHCLNFNGHFHSLCYLKTLSQFQRSLS